MLEQDESLLRWDNQRLIELTRELGCRRGSEQLLAILDAIAWCWAKGGDWRRRVEPVVAAVRTV